MYFLTLPSLFDHADFIHNFFYLYVPLYNFEEKNPLFENEVYKNISMENLN